MDTPAPAITVSITQDQADRLKSMGYDELAKIFGVSPDVIRMMGRQSFLATIDYTIKEGE